MEDAVRNIVIEHWYLCLFLLFFDQINQVENVLFVFTRKENVIEKKYGL